MFYNMRNTYVLTKVKSEFGKYKSIYVLEFFFFFLSVKFYGGLELASNSANIFFNLNSVIQKYRILRLHFDLCQLKVIMTQLLLFVIFIFEKYICSLWNHFDLLASKSYVLTFYA